MDIINQLNCGNIYSCNDFFKDNHDYQKILSMLNEKDELFRKRIGEHNHSLYSDIKLLIEVLKSEEISHAY